LDEAVELGQEAVLARYPFYWAACGEKAATLAQPGRGTRLPALPALSEGFSRESSNPALNRHQYEGGTSAVKRQLGVRPRWSLLRSWGAVLAGAAISFEAGARSGSGSILVSKWTRPGADVHQGPLGVRHGPTWLCAARGNFGGAEPNAIYRQTFPPLERFHPRSTAIAVDRNTSSFASCQECDQLRLGAPGLCLGVPGKGWFRCIKGHYRTIRASTRRPNDQAYCARSHLPTSPLRCRDHRAVRPLVHHLPTKLSRSRGDHG
jgi:hypothetical protein